MVLTGVFYFCFAPLTISNEPSVAVTSLTELWLLEIFMSQQGSVNSS